MLEVRDNEIELRKLSGSTAQLRGNTGCDIDLSLFTTDFEFCEYYAISVSSPIAVSNSTTVISTFLFSNVKIYD